MSRQTIADIEAAAKARSLRQVADYEREVAEAEIAGRKAAEARAEKAEAALKKARETLGSFVTDVVLLRCALERAREEIEDALCCTPSVVPSDGGPEIIYDCGDPWAILRAARARIAAIEARYE